MMIASVLASVLKAQKWLVFGILSIIIGIFFIIWTPVEITLYDRLYMKPGLLPYEMWKEPPVDVYFKIYPFNITNAEAFLNGTDSRLNVEEIGPIVFLNKVRHLNTTFNENGTMSYISKVTPIYVPEKNNISLDAMVVVPNWPLLSISAYVAKSNMFMKMGFHTMYRKIRPQYFVNMTVRNLLWNFTEPFLGTLNQLVPFLVETSNAAILPNFYSGSENLITVFVGPKNGHSKFYTIDKFDGISKVPMTKDSCNATLTDTTDGMMYRQYVQRNSTLKMFKEMSCVPLYVNYDSDVTYYGMDAYKFVMPHDIFHRNPSDCFAGDPILPNGLSDISRCYFDVPYVTSLPHLMGAEQSVQDMVTGLKPDPERHTSYVIVEPRLGVPFSAKVSHQGNLYIPKLVGLDSSLKRFSDTLVPLFWGEMVQEDSPLWYVAPIYLLVKILPVLQILFVIVLLAGGTFMIYKSAKQNWLWKKRRESVVPHDRALAKGAEIEKLM